MSGPASSSPENVDYCVTQMSTDQCAAAAVAQGLVLAIPLRYGSSSARDVSHKCFRSNSEPTCGGPDSHTLAATKET